MLMQASRDSSRPAQRVNDPLQLVCVFAADLPGGEDSERCSPTLEFRSW